MDKIKSGELEATLNAAAYTVLDFSSPGCAPCKPAAALVTDAVAAARKAGVSVNGYAVDITEEPGIAQKFFVLGVPTIIVFKEGREIGRWNGVPKMEKLLKLLGQ